MSFKSVAEFLALTGDDAPTTAERKLIEATQAGRDCYICDRKSPSRPTEATDKTRIRASLLRLLTTGGTKDCGLHERGVSLIGGWAEEELDIAYCTARGQTVLEHCHFTSKPIFSQAHLQHLSLQNSAFPGLLAQRARIKGNFLLINSASTGTVDVRGAKIGGKLDCKEARVSGGTEEKGAQSSAINAQGIETGQDLVLRKLSAVGTVAVNSARIGKALICDEARFDGGKNDKGIQLRAFHAQGVETGQSLSLTKVKATGAVDLNGAKIGRHLGCKEIEIDCGGKDSDGAMLEALNAQRMTVGQGFYFQNETKISGRINLIAAHVGDLADDRKSWPAGSEQVILDGFTYDRTLGPTTLAARSKWLATGSHWQGRFFPQPYTQLARVLRQMGHAGEARLVLIERERLLAEHRIADDRAAYDRALQGDQTQRGDAGRIWLRMTGFRLWTWLTKTIAGYGYAPQRALYCSLVVVPLFALAYALLWQMGAMVPADAILLTTPEWATAVAANPSAPSHAWTGPAASHYETFYSLPYALDVFLPIVDLGQQSTWSQTTVTWWGWGARVTTWVLQGLGYIITTLGLAAATGIIQRNQPD